MIFLVASFTAMGIFLVIGSVDPLDPWSADWWYRYAGCFCIAAVVSMFYELLRRKSK